MTGGTTHYTVAKFAVGSDIQWHSGKVTTQQTINGWKFCTFETGFGQVLSEAFTSNQTNTLHCRQWWSCIWLAVS